MNGTITRHLRHDPLARALCLPALDPTTTPRLEDALLGRRIAAGLRPLLERLSERRREPLALTFTGVGPAGGTVGLELCLEHPTSGPPLCVVFAPALLAPAEASELAGAAPHPGALPDRLCRALFLHRLLGLLSDLSAIGGPRLELGALAPAATPLALLFELRWGGATGSLELRLDEALRARARTLGAASPDAPWLEGLRPSLDLELGSLGLAYPSLSGLRAGDLLLLAPEHGLAEGRPTGPAQLRLSSTRVVLGRLTPDHLELGALARSRPLLQEKPIMSDSPLDALRIDLRLRLGAVPLDLEQLSALAPGVVLPLPYRRPEVELLVEDQAVGRGELVELEGALALRVTERRTR